MGFRLPPPKHAALDLVRKHAVGFLALCWVCHKVKGTLVCAIQAPVCKTWGVIVVCRGCKSNTERELKRKAIFYN